jgi:hypothetical protein
MISGNSLKGLFLDLFMLKMTTKEQFWKDWKTLLKNGLQGYNKKWNRKEKIIG